jgi:hypothetical protein
MWLLWMIAAVSLIAFYTWWASRIGSIAPVAIAATGLVCDFIGESMFMTRPDLERAASLLTGGAANGLYTLGGVALTVMSRSLPLRWLAWTAWAAGTALVVVTVLDIEKGVVITSGALMISFVLFVIGMARQ